jgi:hypothetical protein
MPEACVDDFWNGSPESNDSTAALDAIWTPNEQHDLSLNAFWHGPGSTPTSCSDVTEFRSIEDIQNGIIEQQVVLTPAILYQDLAHKYNKVLEMCESQ